MHDYFISSDPNLLDPDFIVRSLQSTGWAHDRSRELILESVLRSLCFGAYLAVSKQQVGFVRVITDHATFSWLCDVFVDPAHRRRGLGKRLISEMLGDSRISRTRVYLATKDAHAWYESLGFARWEVMRRPPGPPSFPNNP